MAKIVDEMPGRSRASKYQWDEWFDGNVWLLIPGEDFESSVEGFRSSAHNAAKRMGYELSTTVRDDAVYLQATLNDDIEDVPED